MPSCLSGLGVEVQAGPCHRLQAEAADHDVPEGQGEGDLAQAAVRTATPGFACPRPPSLHALFPCVDAGMLKVTRLQLAWLHVALSGAATTVGPLDPKAVRVALTSYAAEAADQPRALNPSSKPSDRTQPPKQPTQVPLISNYEEPRRPNPKATPRLPDYCVDE